MATVRNTSDENAEYSARPGRRNWVWAVVAALIAIVLIYWVASATSHTPDGVGNTATTNATTATGTTGGGTTAPAAGQ